MLPNGVERPLQSSIGSAPVTGWAPNEVKALMRKNLTPGSYRARRRRVRAFVDRRAVSQMTPDLHAWARDLSMLHAEIWQRLVRGVHDRRAPARHPTLATVTPDGRPQARTVVLRAADKSAGTLDIHTDLRSAKVRDLAGNTFCGAACLGQFGPSADAAGRQRHGPHRPGCGRDLGRASPRDRERSYGGTPEPGQPVAQALDYTKAPDPACFAVLRLEMMSIDALHLGPSHRRARFDRVDGWAGEWLAP